MDYGLAGVQAVRYEWLDLCQCCMSDSNLQPLTDPSLVTACFSFRLIDIEMFADADTQYHICETCHRKLNESYAFRCQVEETQAKFLKTFSKNRISSVSSLLDEFSNDGDVNFIQTIKMEADAINSDAEKSSLSPDLHKMLKTKNSTASINSKASIKNENISKTAYSKAVSNLLNSATESGVEKIRNNTKVMTKADLLNYKRVYNRLHYAKSIPFKLKKSDLICNICEEVFSTHIALVSHMAVHYPNHVCDLCGKSFVLKSHLSCHVNTHRTDKDSCPICDKLLKKSSLTRHMKIHTGNNAIYTCPHCKDRFSSFGSRLNHMANGHGVDIYRYHCKICSKKFHLSSSLSKHVRRCHFQELNVTCEECGKGFFDKKSLKEHMLKHTGERNFKCEICNKTFSRKSTIITHMKTHTRQRLHKCNMCDKSYTHKCTLKDHIVRMHSKE